MTSPWISFRLIHIRKGKDQYFFIYLLQSYIFSYMTSIKLSNLRNFSLTENIERLILQDKGNYVALFSSRTVHPPTSAQKLLPNNCKTSWVWAEPSLGSASLPWFSFTSSLVKIEFKSAELETQSINQFISSSFSYSILPADFPGGGCWGIKWK